ncbi:MAG: amino acid ABC transporter ATP-binding protein [Gemmataceae bacterium]|nr:amino acid ABC transporter ATP-binding protein [Gemmataceae bacterium]
MIRVSNLVKSFAHPETGAEHRVLDGVSVEFARGQVAGIVGPSGSGKSTLLRCITGLERFQAGTIAVGDATLSGGPTPPPTDALVNLRRRVGMVFQQFHLFPHMTAQQNVMSGPVYALGKSRAEAEATARKLLDRVGLLDKAGARPAQLSGGQQQRVAIARALAVNPAAILFDEPTSALDPRMAAEVMRVVDDLADDEAFQATMVIVSHDVTALRRVIDTVVVLVAGKVAYSGPPDGAPAGYLE